MKIGYFDCVGGASGDMILSAVVDAGASEEIVKNAVKSLKLDNTLTFNKIVKNAFVATQAEVGVSKNQTPRHPNDLITIINNSDLSKPIKNKANSIINKLAAVEAKIHGVSISEIHLHELGGDDTLIDIIGTLVGLDDLGINEIYVSPLPLARGQVKSFHGILPLPAPATLALLKNVPVYYVDSVQAELVTPTGAVLLTTLANNWGGFPNMKLTGKVGIGAGKKDFPFPNIVRLWLGEMETPLNSNLIHEKLMVLETNIDDMNPQIYGYLIDKLLAKDALDVTLTSIQMKKNRPATTVTVLCKPENMNRMQAVIFSETTTLGIRSYTVDRTSLFRNIKTIKTKYGDIHIKETAMGANPEYEDCQKAAKQHSVPLILVMNTVRNMIK